MKPIITLLTVLGLATFSFGAEGKKPAEGGAKPPAEGGAKPKVEPAAAFKKMDKDGNGSISKEEFLATPQAKKDAAKAETNFGKKDKNKDGSLSMEEFVPKKPKA